MDLINEVEELVHFLNQDMYEESPPKVAQFLEENQVSFNSNGDIIQIEFLGVLLWDSDNDPRERFEDSDKPVVNLKNFIKGKILEIIAIISEIQVLE